jgi:hypothetical protein
MKEIRFRKLYQEPKEGEMPFAIIAYNKIPHIVKTCSDDYIKDWTCSDPYWNNHYIAQYKKYLKLDLWLFTLYFEWFTKEINY